MVAENQATEMAKRLILPQFNGREIAKYAVVMWELDQIQ